MRSRCVKISGSAVSLEESGCGKHWPFCKVTSRSYPSMQKFSSVLLILLAPLGNRHGVRIRARYLHRCGWFPYLTSHEVWVYRWLSSLLCGILIRVANFLAPSKTNTPNLKFDLEKSERSAIALNYRWEISILIFTLSSVGLCVP